ncbi:MAG TPA: 4Fe-4S binding protein, partial [Armatimonadota bacterium]|nr:4Fe-4S binding protein [Armatimonadota bacterium]
LRAPGAEAAHVDGVFAAGDALTGPQTLIDAIAGGHTAAARIHEYLSGERTEPLAIPAGRVDKASLHDEETILTRRQRPRMRPASERVRDFDEVSLGFSDAQAMAEAQRCISCVECAACGQCARICIYGAIEVHNGEPTITTQCDGCGLCVELCPQGAIRMVERADTPGIAALVE